MFLFLFSAAVQRVPRQRQHMQLLWCTTLSTSMHAHLSVARICCDVLFPPRKTPTIHTRHMPVTRLSAGQTSARTQEIVRMFHAMGACGELTQGALASARRLTLCFSVLLFSERSRLLQSNPITRLGIVSTPRHKHRRCDSATLRQASHNANFSKRGLAQPAPAAPAVAS